MKRTVGRLDEAAGGCASTSPAGRRLCAAARRLATAPQRRGLASAQMARALSICTKSPQPRASRASGREQKTTQRAHSHGSSRGGQISAAARREKNDSADRQRRAGRSLLRTAVGSRAARTLCSTGAGEAIIDHRPGWSPFGIAARRRLALARGLGARADPPQRVALEGAATRFSIKSDKPAPVEATGGAPAIVGFTQAGRRETLAFANGVDLHRDMTPGESDAPHLRAVRWRAVRHARYFDAARY